VTKERAAKAALLLSEETPMRNRSPLEDPNYNWLPNTHEDTKKALTQLDVYVAGEFPYTDAEGKELPREQKMLALSNRIRFYYNILGFNCNEIGEEKRK
jgi:hypothetical protein